jgi:hypothetical protein
MTRNSETPLDHAARKKFPYHDEKVLQSKKVKLVETKSGPSAILTASLDVKWCSVEGMRGSRSFRGVVQLTPLAVLIVKEDVSIIVKNVVLLNSLQHFQRKIVWSPLKKMI